MQAILARLYTKTRDHAVDDILALYDQEQSVIVNFIYFANVVAYRLFEDKDKTEKQKEYKKILLKSEFLLADGIALHLFYWFACVCRRLVSERFWLDDFNGTDFVPYFLETLKKKYGSQKLCLLLYGTKDEYLQKVVEKLKFQGYNVIYAQDGYSEFDWEAADLSLREYQDTINILLVARSTPQLPIQELRTSRNYQKIQQSKILVFNTGGLFDFIAGVQSRAPKVVRIMKLEWLWRLITDPKRNFQKVLYSLSLVPYLFRYCLFSGKKTS